MYRVKFEIILSIKFQKFRLALLRKIFIRNEELIKNQYIPVFERHDVVTKIMMNSININ